MMKIEPETQAAVIAAAFPQLLSCGKVVDGYLFKPDACPSVRGACARCRRPGVWIAGAGEILCARHQDSY
jgi:hypothetical protein